MRGLDLKDVGLKDNIYIVKATDGRNTFVKLGFSNSIKKRLVTYLQCNPFTEIVGTCYRDWETDRKSTRLNSSHSGESRMPSSA